MKGLSAGRVVLFGGFRVVYSFPFVLSRVRFKETYCMSVTDSIIRRENISEAAFIESYCYCG